MGFKTFKSFNRCAPFNPPLCLPRDAGEKKRGGLIDLNVLNGLNSCYYVDSKEGFSWAQQVRI